MDHIEDLSTPERHLYDRAAAMRAPIYGVLELSPICNLDCEMCYVRLTPEQVKEQGRLRTVEEWLALAEQMQEEGVLFLLLTGGEPLLYPGFRELYLKLKEMGMILTLNTNGTLIDEEWADFFAADKPRRINITLYGSSNQVYGELCHRPDGFDRAVNGIRLLRERGVDVKINGSLVKENADDWEKLIGIGEQLDAPVMINTHMFPATRERQRPFAEQSRLEPETAAKARVEILKRQMDAEGFCTYCQKELELFRTTPPGEEVPGCMHCNAGKCSFIVNWQGELRTCIFMNEPTRPVFESGFAKAWKEIVAETDRIKISAKCSACEYRNVCTICAAAAMAETGSFDGTPEYLCRYTKRTVELLQESCLEEDKSWKRD